MPIEIRDVTLEPVGPNAALVRRCFQTVADEMGITSENAPRYTAFITDERLAEERERGAAFYGYFVDGIQAGFVTLEKEEGGWFMKRLAVLPDYRSQGIGRRLVDFIFDEARRRGIDRLHIGIVNEQPGLKDWYLHMGFEESQVFELPHLPFTVSLLSINLNGTGGG